MTTQAPSPRAPFLAFAFMMVLLVLFVFKGAATHPPSVTTTKAATGFDGDRAVARLARILGDQRPHPADSDANDAVRERLMAEITAMGYAPEVRDDQMCRGMQRWGGMSCARVRNVVFRAGPSGGGAVMLAAHYDSVPAAPGAGDDGAGVSAALEVAAMLKTRTLTKPVIFVFTDGEEVALLGAASFVRSDPWAKDVALAINMEARGTGGPAIMFQTSSPNSREIAALTHKRVRTVANSLAADIYRTLPNDTDATEFLAMKWDVLNFAFISPLARYHTDQDNLANLETASVAHMGAAALAAVDGHMAGGGGQGTEGQLIYSDVLGRFMVVLPTIAGWVLLGFGFLAAGYQFFTSTKGGPVRALFAPLLSVIFAGGISFGLLFLVNQIRPEEIWWWVHPVFARGLIYGSAILGVGIGFLMCRGIDARRLVSAAWFWLSALFLGISFVAPGAMILAAPAAGLYGLTVVIGRFWKRAALLNLVWIAALLVLMLQTLDFGEAGLGFGVGAGFSALAALISFTVVATAISADWVTWKTNLALAAVTIAATIGAILAPAYSETIPRPLNVNHLHEGGDVNHWFAGSGDEPMPQVMQAITPFARGTLKINGFEGQIAKAPPQATSPAVPSVQIVSDVTTGTTRTLAIRILSPGSDEVQLAIPADAAVTAMGSGAAGKTELFEFDADKVKRLRCSGRACQSWDLKFVLGNKKSDWVLTSVLRGQGPEGQALVKARPAWAAPIQGGDKRMSVTVQGL
jgi:Peptidase family M28